MYQPAIPTAGARHPQFHIALAISTNYNDSMPLRRSGADRRKFARVTIEAALAVVHCFADQDDAEVGLPPLISEDISPDGLFLRTTKLLEPGTRVQLKLHLPTMTQPFTCTAQVMRVEHRPDGHVRGVGLQFLDLPAAQRQTLVEHLYRSYQVQHAHE